MRAVNHFLEMRVDAVRPIIVSPAGFQLNAVNGVRAGSWRGESNRGRTTIRARLPGSVDYRTTLSVGSDVLRWPGPEGAPGATRGSVTGRDVSVESLCRNRPTLSL